MRAPFASAFVVVAVLANAADLSIKDRQALLKTYSKLVQIHKLDANKKLLRNVERAVNKISASADLPLPYPNVPFLAAWNPQPKKRVANATEPKIKVANATSEEQPPPTAAEKLPLLLDCLHHCNWTATADSMFVSDVTVLRAHHLQIMSITQRYRPGEGGKPTAEDLFMHHFIGKPIELFAPLVPIFVQWGMAGLNKTFEDEMRNLLGRTLRKDILYFTVASKLPGVPLGFNLITASSQGFMDNRQRSTAHMILPHLLDYQAPGFDNSGNPIWNKNSAGKQRVIPKLRSGVNEDDDPPQYQHKYNWNFNISQLFGQMPKVVGKGGDPLPALVGWQTPVIKTMRFVQGNGTLVGLRKVMVTWLETHFKHDFQYSHYDSSVCPDTSVPQWGASTCGRVGMLAAKVNVCPVGAHPVSFQLYQALQMGQVPFYIFDWRGSFLPYKGTEAEVGKLGFAGSFHEMAKITLQIAKMDDDSFRTMRAKILRFRDSHFTPKGVMAQLESWFKNPIASPKAHSLTGTSDLRCCANPKGTTAFQGSTGARSSFTPTDRCIHTPLAAVLLVWKNSQKKQFLVVRAGGTWKVPRANREASELWVANWWERTGWDLGSKCGLTHPAERFMMETTAQVWPNTLALSFRSEAEPPAALYEATAAASSIPYACAFMQGAQNQRWVTPDEAMTQYDSLPAPPAPVVATAASTLATAAPAAALSAAAALAAAAAAAAAATTPAPPPSPPHTYAEYAARKAGTATTPPPKPPPPPPPPGPVSAAEVRHITERVANWSIELLAAELGMLIAKQCAESLRWKGRGENNHACQILKQKVQRDYGLTPWPPGPTTPEVVPCESWCSVRGWDPKYCTNAPTPAPVPPTDAPSSVPTATPTTTPSSVPTKQPTSAAPTYAPSVPHCSDHSWRHCRTTLGAAALCSPNGGSEVFCSCPVGYSQQAKPEFSADMKSIQMTQMTKPTGFCVIAPIYSANTLAADKERDMLRGHNEFTMPERGMPVPRNTSAAIRHSVWSKIQP
jgi:hypothetical protein